MGQCPSCGRYNPVGGVFCQYCAARLEVVNARTGGRTLRCTSCGRRLPFGAFLEGRNVCEQCIRKQRYELEQARLEEEKRKRAFVSQVIAEHPELRSSVLKRLGIADFSSGFTVSNEAYHDISLWHSQVSHAKNFEMARRFEDAAAIYESLGLWKEAGNARERKSARTVKHVTVNINDLIDKLRNGGLSVPYKCASCGASIVIDRHSNSEGLKFCSYCGSAIDTDSLIIMLQNVLK